MKLKDARVLIVDDEPILLAMFAKWLATVGCSMIFTASNGAAALELMEGESIDVLLTDVRMPVMDGITLVRHLADAGRALPSIVFVSGFGDVDQREMYALGVEAFIAKPFDRKELLLILEKAVADRSTLWDTEMAARPRQSMRIEARCLGVEASLDTIGLGRGGFSACTPTALSPGKVAFQLLLTDAAREISGKGYVRWYSRIDGKAGVELTYLEPSCRAWFAEAIAAASPRCFIPGG
jgi:CheY-like chemotaxis protein